MYRALHALFKPSQKKSLNTKHYFWKVKVVGLLMTCNRSGRKLCNETLWEYHKLFECCLPLRIKCNVFYCGHLLLQDLMGLDEDDDEDDKVSIFHDGMLARIRRKVGEHKPITLSPWDLHSLSVLTGKIIVTSLLLSKL